MVLILSFVLHARGQRTHRARRERWRRLEDFAATIFFDSHLWILIISPKLYYSLSFSLNLTFVRRFDMCSFEVYNGWLCECSSTCRSIWPTSQDGLTIFMLLKLLEIKLWATVRFSASISFMLYAFINS